MNLRILYIVCIIILISFTITGCWGSSEIEKLAIVMAMGIDKTADLQNVKVTVQISNIRKTKSSSEKDSDSASGYLNSTTIAENISSAIYKLYLETGKVLFFHHNQIVIFNKRILQDGIDKYIDYFIRTPQMRPTMWILVSDTPADEILDVKPNLDDMPAKEILDLLEVQPGASSIYTVQLKEFTQSMMSKTKSPVAPVIGIEGSGKGKKLKLLGTAVFKNFKWVYSLNETETKGFMWTADRVTHMDISIPSPDSGIATLRVLRASSKTVPEIKDGIIYMHIKIYVENNLSYQSSHEDYSTIPNVEWLEQQEAEIIKDQIQEAFNKAKENHTDFLGFGEALHKKYKNEWKELEPNWDEIFPTINLDIQVEAHIGRIGTISKPAIPSEE